MNNYHWKRVQTPNWEPISFGATSVVEKNIYFTGGWNPLANSFNSDVWVGDPNFEWIKFASEKMWSPRNGHTLTKFHDKLILIGGFNYTNRCLNDVWIFDPKNPMLGWTCIVDDAPWEGREGHQSLVYHDFIWIFGGKVNSGISNEIWKSPDGIEWERVSENSLWEPRCFHNVVVYNNKLWLIGGSLSVDNAKNDVNVSDNGKDWKLVDEHLPFTPRFGSGAAVYDNKIWLIGGSDASESHFSNETWWYTQEEGWSKLAIESSWKPRWAFNCLSNFQNQILLICGGVRYQDRKYGAYSDSWVLIDK